MNIKDKSGWLFGGDTKKTHDISVRELDLLFELAVDDDRWTDRVKAEIEYYDEHPHGAGIEPLINMFRTMNGEGTVVQFPFGYICTFRSRRHLFRGENQDYPFSESSLSRRCRKRSGERYGKRETELLHVISNMRIAQFIKFIWQFDIIPQWNGKLSEVNYKALAQHYGFETFLLDITNDVRDALFFATCKWVNDHFEPLTENDINRTERSKYGVIYHSPDWMIDFLNGTNRLKLQESFEKENGRSTPSVIDTGLWDGVAYQIGLQPFYRCHTQNGYVFPMKTLPSIDKLGCFERIRFPQTAAFSRRMFEMMDEGRKIYPQEGITAVEDVLKKMQTALVFSESDLLWAYESDEADKDVFSSVDELRDALSGDEAERILKDAYGVSNPKIQIVKDEVSYPISPETKEYINLQYDDKSFLEPIGDGKLYTTWDARRYRNQRYEQIFGETLK